MTIEDLQQYCIHLPHVTEDIKWGHDLVFSIGAKMFCVVGLDQSPTTASFKVPEEDFETISQRVGFKPAPYVAKYKWVLIDDITRMSITDWQKYILQSYELVKAKLPAKLRKEIDGN